MTGKITLELHHGGAWHQAADLVLHAPDLGIAGATSLAYDEQYVASRIGKPRSPTSEIGHQALSIRLPVDFAYHRFETWPSFLLDLLPQGHARRRFSDLIGQREDEPGIELPLLLRAGGAPIGNMRIKQAHDDELARIAEAPPVGITDEELMNRSDPFLELAERYALIASGSSGVQGEWPKVMLTKGVGGLWYPDSTVPDRDALDHAIVKLLRSDQASDRAILEAEPVYLEIARWFGLRVGRALMPGRNLIVIPRFDRAVTPAGVVRHGQESIVAAAGVAKFGYVGGHEEYLEAILGSVSDPVAEAIEYVLRDLLNMVLGNPDNHGRNTALQKRHDGWIGLTPVFDLAPMRLAGNAGPRSTRWACLGPGEADPDWRKVASTVADLVLDKIEKMRAGKSGPGLKQRADRVVLASRFVNALAERATRIEQIDRYAIDRGMDPLVVQEAMVAQGRILTSLRRLTG